MHIHPTTLNLGPGRAPIYPAAVHLMPQADIELLRHVANSLAAQGDLEWDEVTDFMRYCAEVRLGLALVWRAEDAPYTVSAR